MSGHETIRVLEVEVDAPPSQKDKATALHRGTETMDQPPPPSEDPPGEDPSWRTVILADRQWNGWKDVEDAVPSSAPDGKIEGKAGEEAARPAEQPGVGGTQVGHPVSQSSGEEGERSAHVTVIRSGERAEMTSDGAFLQGRGCNRRRQKPPSLTSKH